MCAGASVYEALDAAGTKADDRVGVVGIGGLGHMAVLFAKAMGCAVTALSSSHDKLEDAFELGADEFCLISDTGGCYRTKANDYESLDDPQPQGAGSETVTFPPAPQSRVALYCPPEEKPMHINVLLITSNKVPNLEHILPLLARRARLVLMTIQQEPLNIPYMPFVLPGHKLIASTEASQENHIKMLEFAARHQIKPWIEEFPMTAEGIAKAFNRLEGGQMRYRGVLVRQEEDGDASEVPALRTSTVSDIS